jgi:hypothetical protein
MGGNFLFALRRHRQRGGVDLDPALAAQEASERSQRRELARHRGACVALAVEPTHEQSNRAEIQIVGLEAADWLAQTVGGEGEELTDVAFVGGDGVRRGVAIQPEVVEKEPELLLHPLSGYATYAALRIITLAESTWR